MQASLDIEYVGGEDFHVQMQDEDMFGGGKFAKAQLAELMAKMIERVSDAYGLNIQVVKKDG